MALDALYKERFLRAIGIMTENDLEHIRSMKIAVAGLGLGGSIFVNLARMGFEKFHIADPDVYERTNINRQRLAKEITIGCRKDDALLEEVRSINPNVEIALFRDGVKSNNAEAFLEGVDWVVDAVDLFAIPDKLILHEQARAKGVPISLCATAGFGGVGITFDSHSPSLAELTGMTVNNHYEKNARLFASSCLPEIPDYMSKQVDKSMNRSTHIPFMVSGVEISAAVVCAEMAKHIIGIGDPVLAPWGIYIDPVYFRHSIYPVQVDRAAFKLKWKPQRAQRGLPKKAA